MIEIDASQVRALAADLTAAAAKVQLGARPVIARAALNIKAQLRDEMGASAHFRGAADSISYDLLDGGLTAEIGPSSEGGSPGNLANIAYFGTSKGGGTVPDPDGALQAEAPALEKALADLIDGSLR